MDTVPVDFFNLTRDVPKLICKSEQARIDKNTEWDNKRT